MKPTLKTIAKMAGVSHMTVSRVVNNREGVPIAPQTRKRILELVDKLGYQPNRLAKALAGGKTNTVTFWMYRNKHPFFAWVIDELEQVANRHGYDLYVANIATLSEHRQASQRSQLPSDGVFAMDCGIWAEWILERLPDRGTPIISMSTSLIANTDSVSLDMAEGIDQATRHLIDGGCRRILYFRHGPTTLSEAPSEAYARPQAAYERAMDETGLETEILNAPTNDHRHVWRSCMSDYLGKHETPDGVVCRNDELAISAYRAFCDLGVTVGKDVSLVGCGGIEDLEYFPSPISTFVMPIRKMCETAWKLFEQRLANPDQPLQALSLHGKLAIRSSSSTRR